MSVPYTYVLLSQEDNRLYTGCTHNLEKRVLEHESGRVSSTAHRVPLELIYFEACRNRDDAFRRETRRSALRTRSTDESERVMVSEPFVLSGSRGARAWMTTSTIFLAETTRMIEGGETWLTAEVCGPRFFREFAWREANLDFSAGPELGDVWQ